MADLLDQPGLRVRRAPAEGQWVLHCAPEDAQAMEAARLRLPMEMLRAAAEPAWRVLHLAPDEWTLIGDAAELAALAKRIAALPAAHSLVDVSSRGVALDLLGPDAERCLSAACPLDLGDFGAGRCTRTLFGKATVLLERLETDECIRMHCWRSFEPYVVALVLASAGDLA
jgi:sarcosine oxidase subunit gamma